MGRAAFPPDLEPLVLKLHGQGLSHRGIAAEIEKATGKSFAHVTIGKVLRRVAAERKPIAQATAQKKLEKEVTSDLDELDAIRLRLKAIEEKALTGDPGEKNGTEIVRLPSPPDANVAVRSLAEQRKVIETKLRFAGAGGDSGTLADLLAEAFEK